MLDPAKAKAAMLTSMRSTPNHNGIPVVYIQTKVCIFESEIQNHISTRQRVLALRVMHICLAMNPLPVTTVPVLIVIDLP